MSGSSLAADKIVLGAFGNDGDGINLDVGTIATLGGLIYDAGGPAPGTPGFIDTNDFTVVAANNIGSDSSATGDDFHGRAAGSVSLLVGGEDAFFQNFVGSTDAGEGPADAFRSAYDQIFESVLGRSILSNLNSASANVVSVPFTEESNIDAGVSESIFELVSVILFPDSILLPPPELNQNLPQRPDDPGVSDPVSAEELAIEQEWQDFYNEFIPEFLIDEGYVVPDEDGNLNPREQAKLERFVARLVAIYESIRDGERVVAEDEFDDRPLPDDAETPAPTQSSDRRNGLSPVDISSLRLTGQPWADGGIGVDGNWWRPGMIAWPSSLL